MKLNVLLVILVIALGYLACKNLQKTAPRPPPPTTETTPPVEDPDSGYNWKAARVVHGDNPDGAYAQQSHEAPRMVTVPIDALPPASASRRAYLTTGWWHLEMAFAPTDSIVHH